MATTPKKQYDLKSNKLLAKPLILSIFIFVHHHIFLSILLARDIAKKESIIGKEKQNICLKNKDFVESVRRFSHFSPFFHFFLLFYYFFLYFINITPFS